MLPNLNSESLLAKPSPDLSPPHLRQEVQTQTKKILTAATVAEASILSQLTQDINHRVAAIPEEPTVKAVRIGVWELQVDGRQRIDLSPNEVNALEGVVNAWEQAFLREKDTWVEQTADKPTLILRVEYALGQDRTLLAGNSGKHIVQNIFEIEERPAGIGITYANNPQFQQRFNQLHQIWKDTYGPMAVVMSGRRGQRYDDHIWTEGVGAKVVHEADLETLDRQSLLLLRTDPEEKQFHRLSIRSISTVKNKGDKSYGTRMGLWKEISSIENLPWETGFAVKPAAGSKMKDVYLWHPNRKMEGISTRTKIQKAVSDGLVRYVQPWIAPEQPSFLPPQHYLIRRVFMGYNPQSQRWECLGGMWNARPCVRIHGASDALLGPIMSGH